MQDNNITVNGSENWVKVEVNTKVFKPPQIVTAAREYIEVAWIVIDSDGEDEIVVKIIPKDDKEKKELEKMGLNFQTSLISHYVENRGKNNQR